MKTRKQIDEQIDRAIGPAGEYRCAGSNYSGMTYEDGVRAALEWAVEDTEEEPMEDD